MNIRRCEFLSYHKKSFSYSDSLLENNNIAFDLKDEKTIIFHMLYYKYLVNSVFDNFDLLNDYMFGICIKFRRYED